MNRAACVIAFVCAFAVPSLGAGNITELLEQLSAPEFEQREAASEAIWRLGEKAVAPLQADNSEDPERRERVAALLQRIEKRDRVVIRERSRGPHGTIVLELEWKLVRFLKPKFGIPGQPTMKQVSEEALTEEDVERLCKLFTSAAFVELPEVTKTLAADALEVTVTSRVGGEEKTIHHIKPTADVIGKIRKEFCRYGPSASTRKTSERKFEQQRQEFEKQFEARLKSLRADRATAEEGTPAAKTLDKLLAEHQVRHDQLIQKLQEHQNAIVERLLADACK